MAISRIEFYEAQLLELIGLVNNCQADISALFVAFVKVISFKYSVRVNKNKLAKDLLQKAINHNLIKQLLEHTDTDGRTLLHITAINNYPQLTQLLLNSNANQNTKIISLSNPEYNNCNIFQIYAKIGNLKYLKYLHHNYSFGFDELSENDLNNLLALSIINTDCELKQFLQDYGVVLDLAQLSRSILQELLLFACQNNDKILVQQILAKNIKPSDESLILSCDKNNSEIALLLLQARANPNARGKLNCTPLILAAQNNLPDLAYDLIERNANIESEDCSLNTALYWAASSGSTEIVKLLFHKGVNLNRLFPNGTALHRAVRMEHHDTVAFLANNGAILDFADELSGNTALHYASEKGNIAIVQLLLANGANANIANKNGNLPIDCAAKEMHIDIVKLFDPNFNTANIPKKVNKAKGKEALSYVWNNNLEMVSKSVDVLHDYINDIGQTALHIAAINGNANMVKLLVANGFNIEAQDRFGSVPINYAKANTETARILVQATKSKILRIMRSILNGFGLTASMHALPRLETTPAQATAEVDVNKMTNKSLIFINRKPPNDNALLSDCTQVFTRTRACSFD